MIFLKAIKRALVKEALNSVDISKPTSLGKVKNVKKGASVIPTKHRTVINDVLEKPENFILEAWLDKDEINVRVKRRFNYNVELEQDDLKDLTIYK